MNDLSYQSIQIRDIELGRDIYLAAHMHMITPCKLDPGCKFCSLSSKIDSISAERDVLTMEEIIKYVKLIIKNKEIMSIILVGGSDLKGHDALILDIVRNIRKISDIDLAIDIGAPLTIDTLKTLKENNVNTIYSSIETINPKRFADAEPGNDLNLRIKLLDDIESLGMNIGTIIMNMGIEKDVIDSINFLRNYTRLKYLYFSTFMPVKGTPWEKKRKAEVSDSIRYIEFSRAVLPNVHIALADVEIEAGSISDWILKELNYGAGNTLAGMLIYKHITKNYIKNMKMLEKFGYNIVKRN
jgi:biotin synthase